MKKRNETKKSTTKMSIIGRNTKINIKKWILMLFLIISSIGFTGCNNASSQNVIPQMIEIEMIQDSLEILPHDSIKNQMIEITTNYLAKSTRGKVNPKLGEYLVNNALEHNIDLCFMLSQTKIETHFGTTGIGKSSSKKSLFGVMKRRYSNYNEAIKDYCKLLKKNYLVKGRTEKDLMRRYVTKGGARYAGNPNYERELSNEYRKINNATNLKNLQNSYNEEYLSYMNGIDELIET